MTYIGLPFVHRVDRVGDNCGIISRGAVAVSDDRALWMGPHGFYAWTGAGVSPVPCEIHDYVFNDLNATQRSKFWAKTNAQDNEAEFHYCSSSSTEIDRCVVYNYEEDHWTIRPSVARLSGVDRGGVFVNPIMATSTGYLYDHETGYSWGGNTPFLESGPIELGTGERTMKIRKLIVDEKTQGDVDVYFKTREWPGDSETTSAAFSTATNFAPVHLAARAVRLRFNFTEAAASRLGVIKLDLLPGSKRLAA